MIGNRVTERDIRDFLTLEGYLGAGARFAELELAAIQRPGWLQIFRFAVTARHPERGSTMLFGAVRDDERHQTTIRLFEDEQERDALLAEWSTDLIVLRNSSGPAAGTIPLLILVAATAAAAAIAVALGTWLDL
ncbi:hypothetical protein Mal4_44110 [Maioricimonas rarisocia]|uniref:Uncharacterized protein n=1 Tax=Maioricimonas rarisocia TaxID=2528026 RepID=A0A517ZC71_9PLAN|nr:hypothetical protein [Maioricimonas rarisocia]QDU40057.1 hypothetical protein Mal4_44110 [Maioricimonas rarisocia]